MTSRMPYPQDLRNRLFRMDDFAFQMFPASLHGTLIVSCQAPPGDPLDNVDTLRRVAMSAVRGGAGGLRANGVENIEAFRRETHVPIIGIQKRKIGGEVSITPDFAAAKSISDAGADIIALDCTTNRSAAAEPWPELIRRIHGEYASPCWPTSRPSRMRWPPRRRARMQLPLRFMDLRRRRHNFDP